MSGAASRPRLIGLGGIVLEVAVTTSGAPRTDGGETPAESVRLGAGGAFPALAAAAAAGLPAALAGPIGTGPLGDAVRSVLRQAGVEVLLAPDPDARTGLRLVLDGGAAGRSVVVHPSTPPRQRVVAVGPDDLVVVPGESLGSAEAVLGVLDGLPPRAVVLYAPGAAGAGVPVGVRARVLARTDWWIGTADEARAATRADPARAAALLGGLVRAGALVRDDGDVLLMERGGEVLRLPVEPSGGAGLGALVGAFAAGLAAGLAPRDAAIR